MAPEPESASRTGWVALAILVVAVVGGLAILLDLGPFADEELSEAEFLDRGDEICAQAHDDFERLQSQPPRTAAEATELTEELVAISRDELDAIAEMNRPSSLDASLDRYLKAREGGIEQLRGGLDAAEDGDAFAYARGQAEVASSQPERLELATRVGFTECSRPLFGRGRLERDAEPPLSADPTAPPTVANPPTGAR
jgi:hypothetical protein